MLERLELSLVNGSRRSSPAASTRSCTSKAPSRSPPTSPTSRRGTSAGCARSGSPGRAERLRRGCAVRFPGSPDTGPGLTQAGLDLVHACNLLGILLDVSHLNEAGFWDVARISQAPLVATHSNAHALCAVDPQPHRRPARRDRRLGRDRRINFAVFLRADGDHGTATPLARSSATSTTSPRGSESTTSALAPTSRGPVPRELGGIAGLPRLSSCFARPATTSDGAREDHPRQLAARARRDVEAVGPLLPRRGPRAAPTLLDAAERFAAPGFAVDLGAGTGRDTASCSPRLARARDRPRAGGDRPAPRSPGRRRAARDARRRVRGGRMAAVRPCQRELLAAVLPAGAVSRALGADRRLDPPRRSLRGQFFGERDDWARSGLHVQTARRSKALLEPFELELLDEFEGDGPTAIGKAKHWHLFHVVARKLRAPRYVLRMRERFVARASSSRWSGSAATTSAGGSTRRRPARSSTPRSTPGSRSSTPPRATAMGGARSSSAARSPGGATAS